MNLALKLEINQTNRGLRYCSQLRAAAPGLVNCSHLRAAAPGLVRRDHHVGCDEESAVLRGRHHVVRLVPHALVQRPQLGLGGLAVPLHLGTNHGLNRSSTQKYDGFQYISIHWDKGSQVHSRKFPSFLVLLWRKHAQFTLLKSVCTGDYVYSLVMDHPVHRHQADYPKFLFDYGIFYKIASPIFLKIMFFSNSDLRSLDLPCFIVVSKGLAVVHTKSNWQKQRPPQKMCRCIAWSTVLFFKCIPS